MTNPGDKAYSYPVKVSHVSANPFIVRISAGAADLVLLAAQWGVPEVLSFTAELTLSRWKRDGVRVKGHVGSTLVQECVVTLDPVTQQVKEDIEMVFLPENSRLVSRMTDDKGEMFLDPDGPDAPELFEGDSIDVGVVAAEFAALAIDPYPRKPGLEFGDRIESDPTTDKKPSPFAVLQGMKRDDSTS